MDKKAFILLPTILLLVVSVSGCTGFESIPFIGSFCIPGLTCAQVVEYESDILVISTLDAVPSTVSTGQQFRLSAWIENRGGETVPQKDFQNNPVKIKLYDTCEGLFKSIKVTCPDGEKDVTECTITSILPKQKIPIFWTLTAYDKDKIPLETSCNLKVYVQYPYRTKSITSISFIDYVEMQRQMDQGSFKAITSYITEGYGPIKPYLTVEDQQPVPVKSGTKSDATLAFQIKNKGSGFLAGSFELLPGYVAPGQSDIVTSSTPKIPVSAIRIQSNIGGTQGDYKIVSDITAAVNKMDAFQLIGKESPKQFFTVETPYQNKIEKVATYYVTTSVDYIYEFRKEIKVTIKPPKIF
ncbi:MAG: hypothetical protein NTY20_00530 [Candidatus Aenigmarchaeota archaeon]|nr:hypothetical protein [Candidatus Aenigmarchaeota archaeon]